MSYFFLILAAIIAVLDWIAVERGLRKLEYFAKPGAMLSLLLWYIFNGGLSAGAWWFAAGMLFSLAGDIFLMLPEEQFVAGLVSFLIGHLAYLAGFAGSTSLFNLVGLPVTLVILLTILLTIITIFRRLAAGLSASGKNNLRLPVLVYAIVISLMLYSALMTLVGETWIPVAALLAGGGALSFFISDTILSLNKFVAPIPHARLLTMLTYHLGQAGIALGAAVHFLS